MRRGLFGDKAPHKIGRFDIVSMLGRGGMGVVYEAYDPRLQRRAAVKVMRPPAFAVDADPQRAQRLLREAQAIARLSHPNVVTVYEVGSVGDAIYMAMELVEGQTLRKWVTAQPRSWREVVDVFVQAGRGIVAAHAVGLVHRDFKPDNVMIDPEGRVRVLDFGLARLSGLEVSSEGDTLELDTSSPDLLTVTGMVLGTPAYMAPEQRSSRTAVPQSDQYSYCVTLYEALYGERPPRSDEDDSRAHVHPARRGPRALRRIIDRGLSRRAHDRFATMKELVDRLQRVVDPIRARWAIGAAGIGAAAVTTLMWTSLPAASASEPCVAASERADSVWNETRKQAIADHFTRQRRGFTEDAWPRVNADVGERIEAWAQAAEQTCQATRLAHTQTEDVRLWRSLCLESQLTRLDSLLNLLQRGSAHALVEATSAMAALDDVSLCDAERAGGTAVRWPEDPATIVSLQSLDLALAAAKSEEDDNRLSDALLHTQKAVAEATAIGFAPMTAKALRQLAHLESAAGHSEQAETLLGSAIEQAEAGRDDEGAATAWIALVHVVGEELARLDDAKRMFVLTNGALQRAGDPPRLRWRWLATKARIHDLAGELGEAVRGFETALALASTELGEHHAHLANLLHGYSRALLRHGDAREALAVAQRAQAIAEARYGPRHPQVSAHLTSIGNAKAGLGQYDGAIAAFERAIKLSQDALGPDHPRLGALHNNLGIAYMQTRGPELALPHFERAVIIDRASLGEHHPHRVPAMYGSAMVYFSRGEYDTAEPILREGLEIVRRAWGPEHPDQAYLTTALADLEIERGHPQQGLQGHRRVLALLEPAFGKQHPRLVPTLMGIARALSQLDRPEDAIVALEKAVIIVDRGRNQPVEAAETRFVLAQALRTAGRDASRVTALARGAHTVIASAGPGYTARAEALATWLDERD